MDSKGLSGLHIVIFGKLGCYYRFLDHQHPKATTRPMPEFITSLVAVFVGFLLGQASSLLSERRVSSRRRRACRALVSLEVGSNLELLADYWHNVTLEPDEEDPEEVLAERYARRAVEIPLPSFTDLAWSSQLVHLPEVLSEKEMTDTWNFYNSVSIVCVLHDKLAAVRSSETSAPDTRYPRSSRATRDEGLTAATFTSESAALVFDLRQIIDATLKTGHPIG